jgi:peroxiredoxin Q/BCP
MTPGCTTEACSFQSGLPDFKNLNAVILGVSKDSVTSHNKFAKKYHLDFLLLSDENSNVCETYETLQMKKNYGREYQGVVRSTYLINPSGIITKVYHKVDVNTHHTELRQDIENFRKV